MLRYDTVDLRALKSWRDGQISQRTAQKQKNKGKTKNKKSSSSEETVRAIVFEGGKN